MFYQSCDIFRGTVFFQRFWGGGAPERTSCSNQLKKLTLYVIGEQILERKLLSVTTHHALLVCFIPPVLMFNRFQVSGIAQVAKRIQNLGKERVRTRMK